MSEQHEKNATPEPEQQQPATPKPEPKQQQPATPEQQQPATQEQLLPMRYVAMFGQFAAISNSDPLSESDKKTLRSLAQQLNNDLGVKGGTIDPDGNTFAIISAKEGYNSFARLVKALSSGDTIEHKNNCGESVETILRDNPICKIYARRQQQSRDFAKDLTIPMITCESTRVMMEGVNAIMGTLPR